MKPSDITIDMPSGQYWDAVRRGDFTEAELLAEMPRLKRESEERAAEGFRAIDAVKDYDNKRRTAKWFARYLADARVWLVKCGRSAWHVAVDGDQTRIMNVPR